MNYVLSFILLLVNSVYGLYKCASLTAADELRIAIEYSLLGPTKKRGFKVHHFSDIPILVSNLSNFLLTLQL